MKKVFLLLLALFLLINGCVFGTNTEKATFYKLESLYIEEPIELMSQSYSKSFVFIPTSTSDRLTIDLYYLNFKYLFRNQDKEDLENIYKSLIGFSIELYDQSKNKLIYSREITENNKPSIGTATPSIFLVNKVIKIERGKRYEIKLNIPAKEETNNQYLKPMFIVGIVPKAQL